MQIPTGMLTQLAGEGRMTLQIPCAYIVLPGEQPLGDTPMTEYPDDWFCWLRGTGEPVTGKQIGFLYLSRRGYEANKAALQTAFEAWNAATLAAHGPNSTRGTWADFERHAEAHFMRTRQRARKTRERLVAAVAELDTFLANNT